MKISLALIVTPTDKEAKRLNKALQSTKGVFDEICVTQAGPHPNEKVSEVIEKYDGKESFFTWTGDFSAARNFNFSQCTGDWIMWIDADDLIHQPENIRPNIELADQNRVTGLSTLYHYSHDENGDVSDSHWKLQMVKAGYYEWRGVIHEDLLPIKDGKNAKIQDVIRVHTANDADQERSLKRNIEILERVVKEEPDEPRHYFYMARCYLGTGEMERVIEVVDTYLTLSNWKEERYDALNMAGEAWMRLGDSDKAIEAHQSAILELEDAPDAYIYKARNYVHKEQWRNALTNLEIAELRDTDSTILKRPALYEHDLYLLSAVCFLQLGLYSQAYQAAHRAHTNRKSDKSEELMQLSSQMLADEELTLMYRKIGEQLIGKNDQLKSLLSTVPDAIKDDPRILALQFGADEPRQWEEDTFTWFCGHSVEPWDGNSAKNGGIGGSETAVIEISKELVKQGKKVTVYNRCDAPAGGVEIDGVLYRNHWEINKEDTFNILALWRGPDLLDFGVKAKTLIIDMHDVSNDSKFTPERLEQIDYVFVKTEYHKSLYPSIPEEKVVVVGNGINLDRFAGEKEKEPTRFIYTSTPNRGLENILDVWSEIKERIPKAQLHIFYGWNTFAEAHKNDPAKMAWMKSMQQKMAQPGVSNHGRVGQEELAEEMAKSALWLYPTEFPEIHCITALEMQAAEVYPITTGYAALAETQQSGVKIEGDPKSAAWREKFVNEIVFAAEEPDLLTEDIKKGVDYVKSCTWDKVTKQWSDVLWK